MPSPRPTVPRLVLVVGGVGGLALIGLLVGVLAVLVATRQTLAQQRDLTRTLIQHADPTFGRAPATLRDAQAALRDAGPLLSQARAAVPALRRAGRQGQRTLGTAAHALDELGPLLDRAGPVLADLGPAAAQLGPLLTTLRPSAARLGPLLDDLAPAAASLRTLTARLGRPALAARADDVLTAAARALPPLERLASDANARELPRRLSRTLPMIGALRQLQEAALGTTRQTLTATSDIQTMFAESLAIQRQLLAHVSDLDHRLGGTTP